MDQLFITDCSLIENHYTIDYFYPDPDLCQNICRNIFVNIFEKSYDFYSMDGLLYSTINRYYLTDIKILEHPLIIRNIINTCKNEKKYQVEFCLHENNIELYNFYSKCLNENQITTTYKSHKFDYYWDNSLTTESWKIRLINFFKIRVTIIAQFFLLVINYFNFFKKKYSHKKIMFWHSFANNRQKIDYEFLNKLSSDDTVNVIHANPFIISSLNKWNKSIYFLGDLSISPISFIKTAIHFFSFKKKFNEFIHTNSNGIKYIPENWNSKVINKTMSFALYNLLLGGVIENATKKNKKPIVNIFRGGAAAGLIYSGICKQKYNNSQVTGILVPHGTEFNPLDHFSYYYLDYNFLPSDAIKLNWEIILNEDYKSTLKYNKCKLLAGGRLDYSLLQKSVNPKPIEEKIFTIGIVLTYNSQAFQDNYIYSVVKIFETIFPKLNCSFLIKPRPNIIFSPSDYILKHERIIISDQDIFSFLNEIDLVIGTVSTYGILTMVVTDAIYRDIPGLYLLMNERFNESNLGYSYHESMAPYSFKTANELEETLKGFTNHIEAIEAIKSMNEPTKKYLTFKEDPEVFLEEFIVNI